MLDRDKRKIAVWTLLIFLTIQASLLLGYFVINFLGPYVVTSLDEYVEHQKELEALRIKNKEKAQKLYEMDGLAIVEDELRKGQGHARVLSIVESHTKQIEEHLDLPFSEIARMHFRINTKASESKYDYAWRLWKTAKANIQLEELAKERMLAEAEAKERLRLEERKREIRAAKEASELRRKAERQRRQREQAAQMEKTRLANEEQKKISDAWYDTLDVMYGLLPTGYLKLRSSSNAGKYYCLQLNVYKTCKRKRKITTTTCYNIPDEYIYPCIDAHVERKLFTYYADQEYSCDSHMSDSNKDWIIDKFLAALKAKGLDKSYEDIGSERLNNFEVGSGCSGPKALYRRNRYDKDFSPN